MLKHRASGNGIHIKAISLDDALSLHRDSLWSARLLKVYNNAVTMVDNFGNPVTLLDSSRRNGPSRILLELSPQSCFRQWPIDDDACFIMHGQYLCDSAFSVFIDLSGAQRWSIPSTLEGAVLSSQQVFQNIQTSCEYLLRHSADDDRQFFASALLVLRGKQPDSFSGKDLTSYGVLFSCLTKVFESLRGDLETPPVDSVEQMIGLGRGLTPSGDDVLCGIICALHTAGRIHLLRPCHDGFLSLFTQNMARYRECTTLISHSFLTWAGEGRCSEEVFSLCEKILTEKSLDIERWGAPFLVMGASSGREVMLGALLGIGALLREHFTGKEENSSG